LFGTKFTMLGRFYPDVFSQSGIEIARPRDDELSFIHDAHVGELLKNVFRPETRDRFLAIVQALKDRAQAVILAGPELPLLLRRRARRRFRSSIQQRSTSWPLSTSFGTETE
jgi:aspartate racemase